jgi:site-specific DNA recombinase
VKGWSAVDVTVRNVAVYIRWSTEDQGEGTTLEVQLEACRSFAAARGWALGADRIYVDDGVSGATMDRPALARLRAAVLQGQVDCVVVYKLDRLSRSVLDMLKLVLEEWQDRCHVQSAREPVDTLTPTGRIFFYQLMSFAEWERSVIRERMFSGKVRRAQEGRNPGIAAAFGYLRGPDGSMQVDCRAAAIVQRIFRLYVGGLGCRSIARALDRDGVRSPTGGQWSQGSIAGILANPAYMGTLWYGKRVTRGERRVRAEAPLALREGFFPPLVSQEEFERVQALRAGRPSVGRQVGSGRGLHGGGLLTGLLRCGCGHACVARQCRKNGVAYRYYACSAVMHGGSYRCRQPGIRQEALDQVVLAGLMARAGLVGERLRALVERERTAQADTVHKALHDAAAEVERLTRAAERVRGLVVEGRMSPAEYREVEGERKRRLREARRALEQARRGVPLLGLGANALPETAAAGWTALEPDQRKQVIRHLVARVRVSPGAGELLCEITWPYPTHPVPDSDTERADMLPTESDS